MKKSLKGGFLAAFLAFNAFCVLGICGAFVNLSATENAVNSGENLNLPSLRGDLSPKQSTSLNSSEKFELLALNLNENSNANLNTKNSSENLNPNFVMLSDSETSLLNLNENSTEIQPTPPSLRGSQSEPWQSTSLNLNENSNANLNTKNSSEISAENPTLLALNSTKTPEIPNQSENQNPQESNLQSPFILINSNILKPEAVGRLTQIGQELYNKTGVFAGLAVSTKFSLDELKSLLDAINPPYAVILMSIKDKKIFIAQNGTQAFVNGEKVLENSVYRLLNQKNDPYGAALVNGYADLTDSLAAYFDLTLESSMGSGTQMTMNVLRIGIYGFICIALLYYFTKRTKRKKA